MIHTMGLASKHLKHEIEDIVNGLGSCPSLDRNRILDLLDELYESSYEDGLQEAKKSGRLK